MKREALKGREFDWWAIDRDDHLALFATAGYGPIPEAVLHATRSEDDDGEILRRVVACLPQSSKWNEQGRGPGKCDEWRDLGSRGVFVYDWLHWSGPYERVIEPLVPVLAAALPSELRNILRAVSISDSFALTARAEAPP